jgi:hypothetical protein
MSNFTLFSDTMLSDNESSRNENSLLNFSLFAPNMQLFNFSLPPDMVFGDAHVIAIVAYSILFIVGVTTNVASLRYVLL